MPPQNLYPEIIAAPQNWIDDTWNTVDTGGGSIADPGVGDIGDNAWFSNLSGNVTLTANTATFNDLDMSKGSSFAGVLNLGGFDIDADGDVTLKGTISANFGDIIFCGGNLDATAAVIDTADLTIVMDGVTGTLAITTGGAVLGWLTIDGNASFALDDNLSGGVLTITNGAFDLAGRDITLTGTVDINGGTFFLSLGDSSITCTTFELSGGIINTTGQELTVDAAVLYTSGSVTELNLTMIGTNTLAWDAGGGDAIDVLTIAGTIATAARTRIGKLSGDGAFTVTTGPITLAPSIDGWWGFTGTVTGSSFIQALTSQSPGGDIDVDIDWRWSSASARTPLVDGNFTANDVQIEKTGAAGVYAVTMAAGKNFTCDNLQIGSGAAEAGSGSLAFGEGSDNTITGAITAGNAANTDDRIAFKGVTTITDAWNTRNVPTIASSGTIVTTGGITVDSDNTGAANDTTWTLAEYTTFDGDVTVQQTAGTTIFFIGTQSFTFTTGSTFTRTAGTITSVGGNMHGGTITGVSPSDSLHCWGVADGGGNSVDVMHEGSNAGAALGGMQSMIGAAA